MPEIPDNPMFNMKPNSLIYGDRMMEAIGGKGFFVGTRRTFAAPSTRRRTSAAPSSTS
jgi:hypothetical protein